MWPFKAKPKLPDKLTYRLRPTDMVGADHYVLEWEDPPNDEWVFIKVVPTDYVEMITNPKEGPRRPSPGIA